MRILFSARYAQIKVGERPSTQQVNSGPSSRPVHIRPTGFCPEPAGPATATIRDIHFSCNCRPLNFGRLWGPEKMSQKMPEDAERENKRVSRNSSGFEFLGANVGREFGRVNFALELK